MNVHLITTLYLLPQLFLQYLKLDLFKTYDDLNTKYSPPLRMFSWSFVFSSAVRVSLLDWTFSTLDLRIETGLTKYINFWNTYYVSAMCLKLTNEIMLQFDSPCHNPYILNVQMACVKKAAIIHVFYTNVIMWTVVRAEQIKSNLNCWIFFFLCVEVPFEHTRADLAGANTRKSCWSTLLSAGYSKSFEMLPESIGNGGKHSNIRERSAVSTGHGS